MLLRKVGSWLLETCSRRIAFSIMVILFADITVISWAQLIASLYIASFDLVFCVMISVSVLIMTLVHHRFFQTQHRFDINVDTAGTVRRSQKCVAVVLLALAGVIFTETPWLAVIALLSTSTISMVVLYLQLQYKKLSKREVLMGNHIPT